MRERVAKESISLVRSSPDRQKSLLRMNTVLLVSLIVIIFLFPVIPVQDYLLRRILLSLIVASGLFAAEFSRSSFRILFSVAVLVIAVTFLGMFFNQSESLDYISFFLNTIFFILITVALINHVARAKDVFTSTLLCAVNSYLLIGLTLSILFIILDTFAPNSFNNVSQEANEFSTFIYYSFVTLTTLGYGDITPATPLARSLSSFTALFGQLYLVTIMAFLIGKYLNAKNQES